MPQHLLSKSRRFGRPLLREAQFVDLYLQLRNLVALFIRYFLHLCHVLQNGLGQSLVLGPRMR